MLPTRGSLVSAFVELEASFSGLRPLLYSFSVSNRFLGIIVFGVCACVCGFVFVCPIAFMIVSLFLCMGRCCSFPPFCDYPFRFESPFPHIPESEDRAGSDKFREPVCSLNGPQIAKLDWPLCQAGSAVA